jgi:aspartyl-tRNA(Asn)/glutamyl-tRNA(Gln) amidotransferase subunit A
MSALDLTSLGAAEVGRLIAAGKADAVDVAEDYLARIAACDDQNIFITVTADRARTEAEASSKRHREGKALGPLDGVPMAWKDLFDVEGTPTTCASDLYRGRAPAGADAPTVANCAWAGMVCLGKVNLTEFAYSGLGLNPHFGTPRNACDEATPRAPGGSSSGSAVAVARSLAPAAIGTDTGGSVRIPASFNGLTGYKSTEGHIDKTGAQPLSLTLDSVGSLGRSVEDCVLIERALRRAWVVSPRPAGLEDLKLVVPENFVFDDAEDAVAANFEAMLSKLSAAGVAIERRTFDVFVEMNEVSAKHGTVIAAESYYALGELVEGPDGGRIDRRVTARVLNGKKMSARDFVTVREERARLTRALAAELEGTTFLAMPTTAITAPEIAPLDADDEVFSHTNLLALRNTMIGNYFNLCGLTMPSGVDGRGLPTGILFNAVGGEDERLLCYGLSIENVLQGI